MITGTINISTTTVTGTVTTDDRTVTGTVNTSTPTITGVVSAGGGSVPPSVLAHISRTDNPHAVTEDQLLHGLDYTLIFENELSQ